MTFADEDCETPSATGVSINEEKSGGGTNSNRMSAISAKYDLNGKGYLDEAEQAMRQMDASNRGFLDLHKVYNIVQDMQRQQIEFQKEQKKSSNLRKTVLGLVAFAAVLALANMGTAFAAAKLAKDTTTDTATGDLLAKGTNERVGTTSKRNVYGGEVNVEANRLLVQSGGTNANFDGTTATIPKTDADRMWSDNCVGTSISQATIAVVLTCSDGITERTEFLTPLDCDKKTGPSSNIHKYTHNSNGIQLDCTQDPCLITGHTFTLTCYECCGDSDCGVGMTCHGDGLCKSDPLFNPPTTIEGCPSSGTESQCGTDSITCEACDISTCPGGTGGFTGGRCIKNKDWDSNVRYAPCCDYENWSKNNC